MNLNDFFQKILPRFRPHHPSAPANTFIFGFVTPDCGAVSVTVNHEHAALAEGIRDAEYLIYGTFEVLKALLNPDSPDRAALAAQLQMRPDYPFNNYLLSIFLNAFDLEIADLDYVAKRFDGPFPFPPRYPAAENPFRFRPSEVSPLPIHNPQSLPTIIADDHPVWVALYEKAWQLAFKNLRQPEPQSGFIRNFIDPAFNANTYLWDSCFMTLLGQYGRQVFDFIGTLDNFYAKQHDDGFICREINTYSGKDLFQPLDPRSTGPNLLAWTEWLHYQHSQDQHRLREVFPVLVAYHRWWKDWRTHPDGSYWTSGWGSGMDNQTRVPRSEYHHRGYAWVDANMQQALNSHILLKIAGEIGRDEFNDELRDDYTFLKSLINTRMWDEATGFYYDAAPDGTLSTTKSIGAYWGMLGEVIPPDRAVQMAAHLEDTQSFNRPHRVPTQAYDSATYNPYGGYWLGGVWSPTNYMVLVGLVEHGFTDLAHQIAHNHLENIARVYEQTGTLWENYSPEHPQPGKPAGRDFVGWTGVSAINILIEHGLGIRAKGSAFTWDIHLTERHGVLRYPLGISNTIDLVYDQGTLTIRTQQPISIEINHAGQKHLFALKQGKHHLRLS